LSISKAREIIEKPGCGITVGVLMIFAMITGIFQCNAGGNRQATDAEKAKMPAIAQIGSSSFDAQAINAAYTATEKNITSNGSTIDGPFIPQILASVLGEKVRQIATVEIGRKYGVEVTNETAVSNFQKTLDEQVIQMRGQLIAMGKLKADADDKAFQEAFKKEAQGRNLDEVLQAAKDNFAKSLDDPGTRAEAVASLVEKQVQDKIMETLKVEDADLKRYRDTVEVKRIATSEKAEADAAMKLVKSSSFEAAMDKFTMDGAPEGKKKSDQTQPISYSEIMKTPGMVALKTLKVGQTSEILEIDGAFIIYKVVKVTPGAIKDFAKEKSQLLLEAKQQISGRQVFEEIQDLRKTVKWSDPGYEALYKLFNAASKKERDTMVQELINAGPPSGENEDSNRLMTFARFSAASQYFAKLPKDQLAKELDKKLAIYTEFLNYTESSQLRVEMAKDLIGRKDASAAEQLLAGANANTSYEAGNLQVWSDVQAALVSLKTAKLGKPEDIKAIEERQTAWKSEKSEYDKAKAAEAARVAAEQKKFEEEQKKAAEAAEKEEAAKKAAGADKKTDTKPTAPSSKDILKGGN
jgi:hypothetical protein